MPPRGRFKLLTWLLVGCASCVAAGAPALAEDATPPPRPNIVYILCDDLGVGDVHALNPTRGKIPTPNVDRLVADGMTFTDAHSSSAVCTPSRYALLTGRYAWRTRLQKGVLNGDSPPLIAKGRLTVAEFLGSNGYSTTAVGKWHLGLEFGEQRWTDRLRDGPLDHGFATFFGISASLDMPPFVFIKQTHFTQPPTVEKKWVRTGPAAKDFEAADVLGALTDRAVAYVRTHARVPFFLYLALASPHTPILPTGQWKGKTGLGDYADFVAQTDDAVGRVLRALDEAGVADNTLVIFTSDNGCSPAAGVKELEAAGHYPSANFRGYKADIWEGGHRVPFVVRWPGVVKAGAKNDAIICQSDLLATCAALLAKPLPDDAAEDSVSMLPLLKGEKSATARPSIVHHSINGAFAIRTPRWKLAFCPGSGGWSAPRDPKAVEQGLPPLQLYDMIADPGERTNVAAEHPQVVRELTELLHRQIQDGRSTPGAVQSNDVGVKLPPTATAEADNPAPPNTLTEKEKADGWRLLFDGKSMDAWRRFKGDEIGELWKVENGAMVMTAGGGGDIVTKEKFDSFELVLEYSIAPGGNSGVMFHVQETDPEPGMNGPEIQLLDNEKGNDGQKAGWLYELYPPPTDPKTGKPVDATKPAGEWNRLRIVIDGARGSIEMNGVRYASFEMWGEEWNRRVAASKFRQWPQFARAKTGHINLQDHGSRVAFRNVKIRPIKKK